MKKIRVLIADDHAMVREGIRALLALATNIEVVAEAANGMEAVEKARQFAPDVVVIDLAMPVMGGLEATRRIRRQSPSTGVLALTQYDDGEYVIPVIEAGARGFVAKTAAFSELASAIQAVSQGQSFLSPSAATAVVEQCQRKLAAQGKEDPYRQLTDRETEVLRLIAEGRTTREIAGMLVVSPKTVEWYRTSLMNKLDIHNRTDLIKFAIRRQIVDL